MSDDVDHNAGRLLLLQPHSTDPSLFSFSFTRDLLHSLREESDTNAVSHSPSHRRRSSSAIAARSHASSKTPSRQAVPLPIPQSARGSPERLDHCYLLSAGAARSRTDSNVGSPTASKNKTYTPIMSPNSARNSPRQRSLKSSSYSEAESAIRRNRLSPTRQIYLHPSQIFSPPLATDMTTYFPEYPVNSDEHASSKVAELLQPSGLSANTASPSAISLPPILTLDELEGSSTPVKPVKGPKALPSLEATLGATQEEFQQHFGDNSMSIDASYSSPTRLRGAASFAPPDIPYEQEYGNETAPRFHSTFYPPTPAGPPSSGYGSYPPMVATGITGPAQQLHGSYGSLDAQAVSRTNSSSYGSFGEAPALSQHGNLTSSPSIPSEGSQLADSPAGYHAELPNSSQNSAGRRERSLSNEEDGPARKRSGNVRTNQPHTGRIVSNFPPSVTNTLKTWLLAHTDHPYPTEDEKRQLCDETNLNMNQISNWFINARRRILPGLSSTSASSRRHQAQTMAGRAAAAQAARAGVPPRFAGHPYAGMPYMAPVPASYPPGYPPAYPYPYAPPPDDSGYL